MIKKEEVELSNHDLDKIVSYLFLQKEKVIDRIIGANSDRGLKLADQQMRELESLLENIRKVRIKRSFRESQERKAREEAASLAS